MDDINFDELDKAVNSAMQQSPSKTEEPTQGGSVLPPSQQGTDTATDDGPSVTAGQSRSVLSSVPKRRGQFMDMVHPSSDMIKPVSARPTRQAPTLQPLSPTIVEAAPEPVTPEVSPNSQLDENNHGADSTPESDDAENVGSPVKSEWPDPLDVMEQTEQGEQKGAEVPAALDESTVPVSDIAAEETPDSDDQAAQEGEEAEQDAPTSPFIHGQDVDKRPLGAFADQSSSDDTSADSAAPEEAGGSEENGNESSGEDDEIKDELPAVPIPQELTPEVVSVESDDPSRQIPEKPETGTVEAEAPSPEAGTMATSIPPQYTHAEAPADDQGDHPVFDTKDYHQPLTPPTKHGHAGLIVALVIVVLALLGAGAWYAVAVLKLF